jgi:quercetin dioxygenase-like cupin family protein
MRLCFAALSLIAAFAFAPAHAADAPPPATMHYWHLYTDALGVSHFEQEAIPFKAAVPGMAKPPAMASLQGASGATLLLLRAGQVENWHNAPRRQFMFVVQGASQVTASDGTVKEFHAGDLVLLNDETGKGHTTKAVGTIDHIALAIPVAP